MFETFFQDSTKRALTKYDQLVNQINALEKEFNNLTDTQLRDYTTQLKVDLCNGVKSNDQITTEAFALVREATMRVLDLKTKRTVLVAREPSVPGELVMSWLLDWEGVPYGFSTFMEEGPNKGIETTFYR